MTSEKISQAFAFAEKAHRGQKRKISLVPYLSHVMAVSAKVIERQGNQHQAIAALLHDVIEDCDVLESELVSLFGKEVAGLVVDCTDCFSEEEKKKFRWQERKDRFIARVPEANFESLLIMACDKWHNLSQLTQDLSRFGQHVWTSFEGAPRAIIGYHEGLWAAINKRLSQSTPPDLKLIMKEWRDVLEQFKKAL